MPWFESDPCLVQTFPKEHSICYSMYSYSRKVQSYSKPKIVCVHTGETFYKHARAFADRRLFFRAGWCLSFCFYWINHIQYISRWRKRNQFRRICLLPPANEVWCKVMFSEASVSHSVHLAFRRGVGFPASVTGHINRGSASRGFCLWGLDRPPEHYGRRSTSGWYTSYWNAFLFTLNIYSKW